MITADERLAEMAAKALERVRRQKPLVHNITNWVVTAFTANATLAVGASPVMAHAHEEAAEFGRLAGAVVLNIGTLTPYTVQAMSLAGRAANEAGVPVVLDPVGYGATGLRTSATERLLGELRVHILRGNAAEMAGLGGRRAAIQGVDAVAAAPVGETAVVVARRWDVVAAVTAAVDCVSDGRRLLQVANGHRLLTRVTGTGCTASALVGAFAAVEPDGVLAAGAALACLGIAAEQAGERASGPGTFAAHLLDALHNLDETAVRRHARLAWADPPC